MSGTLTDARYALRILLSRPGFTLLTVTVMAVCIGLSLYMFTFLNTMAFKALPFEDGEDIVVFDTLLDGVTRGGNRMDVLDFEEIRSSVTGLEEFVAAFESDVNVSGRDSARHYIASSSEAGLFEFTRTQPMLGRAFTAAEDVPGVERVVLISHAVWQSDFGGDPYVLDEVIRVDGLPHRIIGVMPPGFHFPRNSDLWMPLRHDLDRIQRGNDTQILGIARLKGGVNMAQVNQQVREVMGRLAAAYPQTNSKMSAMVMSFPWTQMGDEGMAIIAACYSAAVLLLLLGVVNVGNLLLSRALERDRETATRVALGAPRGRLIMQMMWESLLIILAGSVIGLLLAAWALEASHAIVYEFFEGKPYFWWVFGIDSFSIKVFIPIFILSVVLAGALPAWRVSSGDFNRVLHDGTRGASGRLFGRLSRSLVVAEILLSVTILIAAGVMIAGAYRASQVDYGARAEGIQTARVSIPWERYPDPDAQARFAEDIRRTLIRNGSTKAVAFMSSLPGTYTNWPSYEVEGVVYEDDSRRPAGQLSTVLPSSMAVINMELLDGRFFDSSDTQENRPTAVISASMAERNWPGESALGMRFRLIESGAPSAWLTVVGIVKNTTHTQPFGNYAQRPAFFLPMTQLASRDVYIAYPTTALTVEANRALSTAMFEVDPDVPAYYPDSYEKRISYLTSGVSFMSKLFLLFGAVAVLLAGSGIYGVMSNSVTQSVHEIGVKRALGASDGRVYIDFFKSSRRQILQGAIPGVIIGGALGYLMASVTDHSAATLATMMILTPLLISIIVLLATWLPVRRALMLEPSEALRHE